MIKIMIDAGHDGKRNASPCKTSSQYYESVAMFELSKKLQKLGNSKLQFDLTRTDLYQTMSVEKRGKMAKGYDCFISLHTNATGGGKPAEGTDRPAVIYPVKADAEVIKLADNLGEACAKTIGTKQSYKNYSKKQSDGRDYYGVIRNAVEVGCPYAYILECTFHTDTQATEWLLRDTNLDKLALAIRNVLYDFFVKEEILYTVQCGAFSKRENAEKRVADLAAAGFAAIIKEVPKD